MAIQAKRQIALPAGTHTGIIVNAQETTKVFDPSRGPEPVVEFTIQPKFEAKGAEVMTVSVIFAPSLNGLSGLSKMLERLGLHPEEGAAWNASEILGVEVQFKTIIKDGFVRVDKDSITAIPGK